MFAPSISSWVFVTYMLREIHSQSECSNMRKIGGGKKKKKKNIFVVVGVHRIYKILRYGPGIGRRDIV